MFDLHLFSQGYENAELINFELSMTSPSTIYEQEKLTLYTSKVDLAGSMIEKKLMPREWIYKNIFNFNDEDVATIMINLAEDQKEAFRYKKIEEEGEDPANPTGKKKEEGGGDEGGSNPFGGGGEEGGDEAGAGEAGEEGGAEANPFGGGGEEEKAEPVKDSVDPKLLKKYDSEAKKKRTPKGGWPGAGRPKEGVKYNTHDHPRGYDPIGRVAWKNARNESVDVMKKYGLNKLISKKSSLLSEINTLSDNTNIIDGEI